MAEFRNIARGDAQARANALELLAGGKGQSHVAFYITR
jgi:hypothetical protein